MLQPPRFALVLFLAGLSAAPGLAATSERSGGGIFNEGVLDGSQISVVDSGDDETSSRGGGIANVGPNAQAFLRDCELRGNTAVVGGAFHTSADFVQPNTSVARLERCSVVHNTARQGGAALAIDSQTVLTVTDSTISSNNAGGGGGRGGCWCQILLND